MAKQNKNSDDTEFNSTPNDVSNEEEKGLSENGENNIDNNSIPEKTMATTKTDEQVYKEIQALKPRAKFQEYFEEKEKALKNGTPFKNKVITIGVSNQSVPYEDIMSNIAYSIKKYKLSSMFDLSEEQQNLIASKNLFWFAQKRF